MNKSFLASSAVMIAAAALGYWIMADPFSGPNHRKSRAQLPATEMTTPPVYLASIPPREIVESIDMSQFFEPTGEELYLQNLLLAVTPEYLPEPRVVAIDWLADAGEESSSPPDGLTLLTKRVYRLAAWKCAELIAAMEPLIGTERPWGEAVKSETPSGAIFNPLTDDPTEAQSNDLQK